MQSEYKPTSFDSKLVRLKADMADFDNLEIYNSFDSKLVRLKVH